MTPPYKLNTYVKPLLLLGSAPRTLTVLSLLLILTIVGVRLGNFLIVTGGVVLIGVVLLLVTLNRWPPRLNYISLYVISLCLIFFTTLPTNYLIGSDIHVEYYFAHLTQTSGWDYSIPLNMNNALSITLFAPFLSDLLHIDLLWIFKVIFPLFYALVPVILYYIFTRFMGEREAFISAFFFVIIPSFFMEVAAIARQQIAEVFFVSFLALLVLGPDRLKMRNGLWFGLLVGCGAFTIVSHYTTGGLLMFYGVLAAVFIQLFRVFKVKMAAPIPLSTLGVMVILVLGLGYYGFVSGGTSLHDFLQVLPGNVETHLPFLNSEIAPPMIPVAGQLPSDGGVSSGVASLVPSPIEPLMQTALGLDFLAVPVWAKIFRVFQYITQALLVIGLGYFLWNFKRLKFSGEYLAVVLVSCVLLGLCIFRPGFSSILNASRFYHFTLMLMAPMIVLGGKVVFSGFKRLAWWVPTFHIILAGGVLLPYFLFTSGFVFEATKQPDIKQFSMPYSYTMSSHRIDLWGNFNEDDRFAREGIAVIGEINDGLVIYTDVHSRPFLQERVGYTVPIYFLPRDMEDLPADVYVFLRSYNNQSQTVAYWVGAGMREFLTYEELGLPEVLSDRPVIFEVGEAVLYGSKRR